MHPIPLVQGAWHASWCWLKVQAELRARGADAQVIVQANSPAGSTRRPRPFLVRVQRFGSLPRSYIACTEDRVVSYAKQLAMLQRVACARITTLQSSHAPFFSQPVETADAIWQFAGHPAMTA